MPAWKRSAAPLRCAPLFTRAIGALWYAAFLMRSFTSTTRKPFSFTVYFTLPATLVNGVSVSLEPSWDFVPEVDWPRGGRLGRLPLSAPHRNPGDHSLFPPAVWHRVPKWPSGKRRYAAIKSSEQCWAHACRHIPITAFTTTAAIPTGTASFQPIFINWS